MAEFDCKFSFLDMTNEKNVESVLHNKYSRTLYMVGGRGDIFTTKKAAKNCDLEKRILTLCSQAGARVEKFLNSSSSTEVYAKVYVGSKIGYMYIGTIVGDASLRRRIISLFGPKIAYSYGANGYGYDTTIVSGNDIGGYFITSNNELNPDGTDRYYNFKESIYNSSETNSKADDDVTVGDVYGSSDYGTSDSGGDGDIDVPYTWSLDGGEFYYNISDFFYNERTNENGNTSKGISALFNETMKNVETNGLHYSQFRTLFGAPYQYLPTTDSRCVNGEFFNNSMTALELAGYEFANKILSRMPLLYITPGNTSFMGSSSKKARASLISNFMTALKGKDGDTSSLAAMLDDYTGKLYTIVPAYAEYFQYVNAMTRAGAIFLNIGDEELNGSSLAYYHWGVGEGMSYIPYKDEDTLGTDKVDEEGDEETSTEVEAEEDDSEDTEEDVNKYDYAEEDAFYADLESNKTKAKGSLSEFLSAIYYDNAVAFYINSEATFQETFSNETTDSLLATTINSLSDRAREVQFLLGTASSAVGEAFEKVDGTLTSIKEQINSIVERVAGGNSIFTTIANSVKTIVSGGRMQFPQIWSNSSLNRSYNVTIKLVTPGTDLFSWWLDIFVPLCHLAALVMPRSEYVNSYTTPFLVKAFYKGMFNIDMGIITEMSFSRGKEGSWTKDGLPTVVEVSFTIQDLYTSLGMTSFGKMFKGFTIQNVAEMDYLANLCGININEPDLFRMVKFWAVFKLGKIADFLPNLKLNMGTYIKTNVVSFLNNLWM
jgi:hypothetical protein